MFIVRQGDVLIMQAPKGLTPQNQISRDKGRIVLAYGEVTGHAHVIIDVGAELLTLPNTDDRFLRIMKESGVELRHEEHSTIALPPGNYIVRKQREYVPNALPRWVAD